MTMHPRSNGGLVAGAVAVTHLGGCASTSHPTDWQRAHDPCPEAQAELRAVLEKIILDAETGNVEGLREVHLESDKFTKFGGGEVYERMNYAECVESETAAVTSAQEYSSEG